jgi:hypothetical protein
MTKVHIEPSEIEEPGDRRGEDVEAQMVGESRYIIWSMAFDWEPVGDPNGRPVNFQRWPPSLKSLSTLHASSSVVYWLWRESKAPRARLPRRRRRQAVHQYLRQEFGAPL